MITVIDVFVWTEKTDAEFLIEWMYEWYVKWIIHWTADMKSSEGMILTFSNRVGEPEKFRASSECIRNV